MSRRALVKVLSTLVRPDLGGIIFGPASDEFACFRVSLDGDEAYVAECVEGVVLALTNALGRLAAAGERSATSRTRLAALLVEIAARAPFAELDTDARESCRYCDFRSGQPYVAKHNPKCLYVRVARVAALLRHELPRLGGAR